MYALNYGYSVNFSKTLERKESYMQCNLRFHRKFVIDTPSKFMCIQQIYVYNKCYYVFNWEFKMKVGASK